MLTTHFSTVWKNLRPKLEHQLALAAEHRRYLAFIRRAEERHDQINEFYDEYITDHLTTAERDLMPNFYDTSKFPCVNALAHENRAHGSVTREAFLAIIDDVLDEADAYKARVQHALADLLLRYCPELECEDAPVVPVDALTRYGAFFACEYGCVEDDPLCMTYPELHKHWRAIHSNKPFMQHWTMPQIAGNRVDTFPSVARKVLTAVGIPLETTFAELDGWVKDGKLFCSCGDPSLPLPEDMDWRQLVRSLPSFGFVSASLTYA